MCKAWWHTFTLSFKLHCQTTFICVLLENMQGAWVKCFTMNNNWRRAERLCNGNVTKSIKIYKKVIRHSEHRRRLGPPHPLSSLTMRVLTTHWRAGDRRPLYLWPHRSLRPTHARVKRRLHNLNLLVYSPDGIFKTSEKIKPFHFYKAFILHRISAAIIQVRVGWAVTVTIITITLETLCAGRKCNHFIYRLCM